MKGREALRELIAAGKPKEVDGSAQPLRSAGAIRTVGLGLQHISEEAAQAKALRAVLAGGEQVVELAPADIDISSIADRMPSDEDPEFESLLEKIRDNGQLVPILVRPHPSAERRYEVAYGRRRLRVAVALGRPVKAIVRKLSDAELVIAQGQENGERRDLSFIERALFASQLNANGFDRDTITAALGVDKPELSRLLRVVEVVDSRVILAIGPAPKIGRPRWLLLVDRISTSGVAKAVDRALKSPGFAGLDTNARFNAVLSATETKLTNAPVRRALTTPSGQRIAWLESTSKGVRLTTDKLSFAAFLESRLPDFIKEFEEAAISGSTRQIGEEREDT